METTKGILVLDITEVGTLYKDHLTEEEWDTLLDIIANWKDGE